MTSHSTKHDTCVTYVGGGPAVGFFLYGAVTFSTLYLAFYDGHIAFKETFTRDLSMIECLVHIL